MRVSEPLVSICCFSYNHASYIREALEGFLIQKTDFPFEILVHDDASNDETVEILHQYQKNHPEIFRVIYQTENQYSQGIKVPPILYRLAKGKYIALCEGDDYWTDPLKLQKQVDFMESHPECSLSCHKVIEKHENGIKPDKVFPNIQDNQLFDKEYLYRNFFIRTCSVMFRNTEIDSLIKFLGGFAVGDAPLFYYYAQRGDIGYIDDCMAVYRIHDGSIWSSKPLIKILLDTLSTRMLLQRKLKIYFSKAFHQRTLELLLGVIEYYKRENDQKNRKRFLNRSIPYFLIADKLQKKKIIKHIQSACYH